MSGPSADQVPAFAAGPDHRFQGDPDRRGAGAVAARMSLGSAAELEHAVGSEDVDQFRHVPDVDAARRHREDRGHRRPGLVEVDAPALVRGDEVFPQQVVDRHGGGAVSFELADHGPVVQLIAAGHPQPLGDHPPVDAVVALPVDHRVHGPVAVQQHAVVPAPARQRGVRGEAHGEEVGHDDRRAKFPGELGPLVDILHRPGRHVQVVSLALAGLALRLPHGFHGELETVAPAHDRLGVDVLVVLGEVQAAAQQLVDRAAVVAGRQPDLRLDRAAQQRPAVLVELVALHRDAVRRAGKCLQVGDREPQILQPQRPQRLEAEDIADDGGQQVDDRALLEQVEGVGDVGDQLIRLSRDRLDLVAAGPVPVQVGEQVGPHRGPGARG